MDELDILTRVARLSSRRAEFNFLDGPLGAQAHREFRPQHLDGHLPVQLEILGEIDDCHPAAAELALDSVAVGECG